MKIFSIILLISFFYIVNSSNNFFIKKKIKDFPFKPGKISLNHRNLDESSTIDSSSVTNSDEQTNTGSSTNENDDSDKQTTTDPSTDGQTNGSPENDSSVTNSDEQTNTGSSTNESDDSDNQTTTDPSTDRQTNGNQENNSSISELPEKLLLGFDNYTYKNDLLSFLAHVRYAEEYYAKETIHFILNVTRILKLRNLEVVESDIVCNNTDIDSKCTVCKYYCSQNITGTLSNVEVILNKTEDGDIALSKYAEITGKSLQKQTGEIIGEDFIIISDCNITNETDKIITIKGNSDKKTNSSNINLYVIDNSNKTISVPGQLKFNNSDDKKVEIILNPQRSVVADIDKTIGIIKDDKGKKTNIYLNFDKDAKSSVNFTSKGVASIRRNDKGMSGGAIVGIILPCFAALLGVTAVAYFYGKKKPDVPPSQNIVNNTIGVNSSTNIVN